MSKENFRVVLSHSGAARCEIGNCSQALYESAVVARLTHWGPGRIGCLAFCEDMISLMLASGPTGIAYLLPR